MASTVSEIKIPVTFFQGGHDASGGFEGYATKSHHGYMGQWVVVVGENGGVVKRYGVLVTTIDADSVITQPVEGIFPYLHLSAECEMGERDYMDDNSPLALAIDDFVFYAVQAPHDVFDLPIGATLKTNRRIPAGIPLA